jgi:nicotinate-nucleotide pyrophosphorylase (carboxylating)
MNIKSTVIQKIIMRALKEDIGAGDITTLCTMPEQLTLSGELYSKSYGVIAGIDVFAETFRVLDPEIKIDIFLKDSDKVQANSLIAEISGSGRALLSAERTALNFLQRMSGIATMTRKFVDVVAGTKTVILDTRKTAPGLRVLDKWAVRIGGGQNHRYGLYDMVLVKENHIAAAGSICRAVENVREVDKNNILIEIEVKTIPELQEALNLGVDRIMLDNMSLDDMIEAVRITNGKIPLEASGNISLKNVRRIAETGVDFISVGMLTHSVHATDISFLIK